MVNKKLVISATILFLGILFLAKSAMASWTGPVEVVSGQWGKADGQFTIEYGDSGDYFPHKFGVDLPGRIYISDLASSRIQVFGGDGSLLKVISTPRPEFVSGWPYSIYVHPTGGFVAYKGNSMSFYDKNLKFVNEIDIVSDAHVVSNGYYVGNASAIYSVEGELVENVNEKPTELGIVKTRSISDDRTYRTTIVYPDNQWVIEGKSIPTDYERDVTGKLFTISRYKVATLDDCSFETVSVAIPKDNIVKKEIPPKFVSVTVHEEYGTPIVAPNGDIYTWKRTPDKYSILKWTWKDDPNTPPAVPGPPPSDFEVISKENGLKVWWDNSPQDPGCVTGYEVVRADKADGTYSTVGDFPSRHYQFVDTTAEIGQTYYYKIRAKGGEGYSEYTAPVAGTRQAQ